MARASVEFLPEAVAETAAARAWYAELGAVAVEGFEADLSAAVALVAELPEAWPAYHLGTRRLLLRRYPFALVYRIDGSRIEVVAVAHLRRRPGYWGAR